MAIAPLRVSEFFLLFWLAVLAHISGTLLPLPLLQYTTKPLLIPLLAAALIADGSLTINNKKLLLAGILFSWAGDVLLMFEYKSATYFIAGLSSFLCAHIMYIIYFLQVKAGNHSLLKKKPLLMLAVVAYTSGLVILLYPSLGSMRIPVLIYAAVIATMLLCCLHAYTQLPAPASKWLLTGAIFFVLSDSLLAINKFHMPLPFAGASIMLTYCIAQFCIVKGGLLHNQTYRKNKSYNS
jgi:uncharacterized membrane protein YhhN